jgi:hypothetical protein
MPKQANPAIIRKPASQTLHNHQPFLPANPPTTPSPKPLTKTLLPPSLKANLPLQKITSLPPKENHPIKNLTSLPSTQIHPTNEKSYQSCQYHEGQEIDGGRPLLEGD